MDVKLDVVAPLGLDELVDLLLRLALGVEVRSHGRHAGKEAKTGLLECVLYQSLGSSEATQDHRILSWQQHVLTRSAATQCDGASRRLAKTTVGASRR